MGILVDSGAVLAAAGLFALAPASAEAYDAYPCGKQMVANPPGSPAPAPAGWLYGTEARHFVCDRAFPGARY